MGDTVPSAAATATNGNDRDPPRVKLHGRAFYESIGSPKVVLAPMVDQSEFAWRMLSRSFMKPTREKEMLAYTPMFHARLFGEQGKTRSEHFQPIREGLGQLPPRLGTHTYAAGDLYMDGHPERDRPLFVQFCANDPDQLLAAAQYVAPFCDAVDLNLGCPQGIARRGNYGAFLQEDPDLICRLINILHRNLDVPVTAKIRVLETKEKTLEYARRILDAGASILTVHGRQRHQKGHETGVADWSVLKYLRENLPPDTVLFSNGNILQRSDIQRCLEETGADAVMSAEGNLCDPTIFGEEPPLGEEGREFWRSADGLGGYRMDAVFRRYMDIMYRYVLEVEPPQRAPLYIPGDPEPKALEPEKEEADGGPAKKKRRRERGLRCREPNQAPMQAHLFAMLRPLVSQHHDVRDALARTRAGQMDDFERVLRMVERVIYQALRDGDDGRITTKPTKKSSGTNTIAATDDAVPVSPPTPQPMTTSRATVERCRRPWWVCQPYVRPLPEEAIAKGSLVLTKKELARREALLQEQEPAQGRDAIETRGDGPSNGTADAAADAINAAASAAHGDKRKRSPSPEPVALAA